MQVDKYSHKDAGMRFSVSSRLVQTLVKESKDAASFPKKIKAREEKRKLKLRLVMEHSLKHLNSKVGLSNSKQVQKSIQEEHGLEVNQGYISSVLRNDIGARYKPIKKIPYIGNTARCLILR